ncbi:MAG: hypothetical protein V4507_10220 [Verrucomicrobiota bacterium]
MAVAREYYDTNNTPFSYGNPYSPSAETPRHYFQPMTFGLGVILSLVRINPGLLFLSTGVLMGILAIRTTIALFEFFHPIALLRDLVLLLIFVWGGGLLSLGGLCFSYFHIHNSTEWLMFDPSGGWWFLNLGRNFIYPLESAYHLLFFLGILFWGRKQWHLALAAGFLLSISHPFTGIQFLVISLVWLIIEKTIQKEEPPLEVIFLTFLLTLSHIGYYLFYLNRDPEHHSVMEAWKINFSMSGITFCLNLFPLLFILWWGLRHKQYPLSWIQSPMHRLLLVSFAITLLLVFHDRFMTPIQPLHFDRGYLWVFAFLIAMPGWKSIFKTLSKKSTLTPIFVLITFLFLSDNFSWMTSHINKPTGFYETPAQKEVFDWLDKNSTPQDLLVSEDQIMCYLAPTYSSVRTWYAFWWFTPNGTQNLLDQKKFFESGETPSLWKGRSILLLQPKRTGPLKFKTKKLKLFDNADYRIWQIQP